MKKLTLAVALFGLVLTSDLQAAETAEIQSKVTSYYTAGKAVVEQALTKKVDADDVAKKVDTMVNDAVWLAKEYGKSHPKGGKLLQTVVDNVEAMRKLNFKDLEHLWHDLHHFDGKDVGIDLKDEDNEHFTDPIHAIVHPLLVLKAAEAFKATKDEANLKQMKEEMEEGLQQVEKTSKAVGKKTS